MFSRRVLIITFMLLSILLTSSAGTQAQQAAIPPTRQKRHTITVKYAPVFFNYARQLRPVVVGTFPNKKQALFCIDTGTTGDVISEHLAHNLGLITTVEKSPSPPLTLDGRPIDRVVLPNFDIEASSTSSPLTDAYWLRSLEINGPAFVIPSQHANFFGADGLIGTKLLFNLGAVVLDGSKQQVTFVTGGNLTAMEREQLGFSSAAVSAVLTPQSANTRGPFTTPVVFENNGVIEQVALLVDTGADSTSVPRRTALKLGLNPTSSAYNLGITGKEKVNSASVDTISISGLKLHNASVFYASEDNQVSPTLQPEGSRSEALGMDILSGYRVLIDFPARTMYIMPSQPRVKIVIH